MRKKPARLAKGDKVAIVSLSSGILGDDHCAYNVEIGTKRMREMGLEPVFTKHALAGSDYIRNHPEKRAEDIKAAFLDERIKGIVCAIGGDDTYRTLPYLMEDEEFREAVVAHPKIFTGYSDTTINHLMFYQLGLQTFYGPSFLTDFGDIGPAMLPYTKSAIEQFIAEEPLQETILPSAIWYEERKDFSAKAKGEARSSHQDIRGFELLQGAPSFTGHLLGGCFESLTDFLSGERYPDEKTITTNYHLWPESSQWQGAILFIETCEEKISPEAYKQKLGILKETGVFSQIAGIIVGKPQDECFYEEYKSVLLDTIADESLPIAYNFPFGHAYPRTVLPYGINVTVDTISQVIRFNESLFR